MRQLEIWTLTGGYLILNNYLLVLFSWNTNIMFSESYVLDIYTEIIINNIL